MTTLTKVEELMDMLTGGDLPEGITMPQQPCLSRGQAFSVIWFLQEHLRIIPDRFEMCDVCESLFDAERGGHVINGTDSPDIWYKDVGVAKGMLEESDGAKFCSEMCEIQFWREITATSEQDKVMIK